MYRNSPQRLPLINSNSPPLNIPKGFKAKPSNLFAQNFPLNNGFHVHSLSAGTENLLKNLQPGIKLEKQPEAPMNYINLYFRQSPFNEINYLQRLLAYQSQDLSIINKVKTRFYKLGTNTNPSDEIMVYIGHRDSSPYFCKLSDFSVLQPRNIKFYGGLQKLVTSSSIEDLKKVGWIVLNGDKWGFLLDLESLEEARKGNLPGHWQRLVRTEFFLKQLKKAEKEGTSLSDNHNLERDKPIIASISTSINDKLMAHQRDDINWMYNLEKNHNFEIREKAKGMPFFDTGYCFSKDLTQLHKEYTTKGKIQIQGGILNNETGSGKTASIIGLIASEEEYKNSPQKQSLVITTEYTLFQWQREFEKFAPNLRVLTIAEWSDLEEIKDSLNSYDVILTHRKILEEGKTNFATKLPEIYNINFQRIIFDEIHEILNQYNKKKEVAKKFRTLHNQYPAQQENQFSTISNIYDFLQTIRKLQKDFIWGISASCIPNEINPAFFNLINLDTSNYSPEIKNDIKDHFFENHFRVSSTKVPDPDLNKAIIKAKPYQIQNFYSNSALRFIPNQVIAKKVGEKQLIEFKNLENEPDSVTIALEMIDNKQENEINKIQIEIASSLEENDHTKALERRIQALQGPNNFYAEAIQLLLGSQFECPICLAEQPVEKIVVFSCLHQLCDYCYTQINNSCPKCPICKEFTSDKDLIMHPRYRGPKENKLMNMIKQIQEIPAEEKVVIFTQFHALLEVISQSFKELKISHLVLRGNSQEISKTLKKFKENSNEKVLVLSVEQGASGIDISEANHVFFAHLIFEGDRKKATMIYNQCIGRVLRLEQKKKVNVKLFVSQNVEDEAKKIFIEF